MEEYFQASFCSGNFRSILPVIFTVWHSALRHSESDMDLYPPLFYHAVHFSAYARSWDRMSSVRLSVTLVDCDHIHCRLEILETNCTDN